MFFKVRLDCIMSLMCVPGVSPVKHSAVAINVQTGPVLLGAELLQKVPCWQSLSEVQVAPTCAT